MSRSVTPRLVALITTSGLRIFAALVTGRVEMVAVAACSIVALLAGVASSEAPDLRVDAAIDTDRCLEGDTIGIKLDLTSTVTIPELRIGLVLGAGFASEPEATDVTMRLQAGLSRTVSMEVTARGWGVHPLGVIATRSQGPGGFIAWEKTFDRCIPVKVFPHLERIRRGLNPARTQMFAGNYVSSVRGDGIEFAQVRPFEPGDRVRSVNWRVTTRRDSLHVNVFHPERNMDVVVFIDTFGNFGEEDGSLEIAVRGAAGVVRHHLRYKDRVGLIAFGGEVRWLTASMGRTQVYRIVDALLESRALFSYAWKDIAQIPRGTLPPSCVVIAFSPLIDRRAVDALRDLAWRGWPLVIVDTLPEDQVAPRDDAEGLLAHRVWRLQRRAVRADLVGSGIPVVGWTQQDGLDAVLASIPRPAKVRT